ncbi:hypothetical protein K7X08_006215 [Anisodus acutangulus]|uniref:Uncharacterized protein n=1 Tax=Anisodus acutangulus TaxID=402998 RepID=A0A9Q1RRS3_9SOLA|nr:hypothetical protein K7X08_006215 [Anisodus acutangulus]
MVDFNLVGFWRTMVHLLALVQKSHRRNPTTMLSKAQAFQESIAHLENEIVEQNQGSGDDASDEDYDNYKFIDEDEAHNLSYA